MRKTAALQLLFAVCAVSWTASPSSAGTSRVASSFRGGPNRIAALQPALSAPAERRSAAVSGSRTARGASTGKSPVAAPLAWPVNAPNEWGPLREVIVGRMEGATVPDEPMNMIRATMPSKMWAFYRKNAGKPFPAGLVGKARKELEAFARILTEEGVRVRRPEDPGDLFSRPIVTPHWKTKGGVYAAMPRDNLLAVGREIIEAPMAWRSRHRENVPYDGLLNEYERGGARRTVAPRPLLTDRNYRRGWRYSEGDFSSVITEEEPTFDAADFLKFGRHLVGQQSHVTNLSGIRWLREHLGGAVKVAILQFLDSHPMHIDATIMPLREGLLLVNPERVPDRQIAELKRGLFKGWDFVKAPPPALPDSHPLFMTSKWLNMNIITLDEERAVVEAQDEPMRRLVKRHGFRPIPVPFRYFNCFGGSFHCATLDVRRDGQPKRVLTD